MPTVTVCIATYRRKDQLAQLLVDITNQELVPNEVVVVDNDPARSAEPAVTAFQSRSKPPFAVLYDVQPQKNISLTRNRTVAMASSEWLAFIDDDERPCKTWLSCLAHTSGQYGGASILGPVVTEVPDSAPGWIRRGAFYVLARLTTGSKVPANMYKIGNAYLNAAQLRSINGPFDVRFGLTGGEDGDMLSRYAQLGNTLIWCDEAIVSEPVAASRLNFRWLFLRALRGGQDFAYHTLAGHYGQVGPVKKILFFARASAQLITSLLLALACLPVGLTQTCKWIFRAAGNAGKLSAFFGAHYREYA